MRIRHLIALCSALVATPAAAERWYYLTGGDYTVDYADADSVSAGNPTASLQVFRGLSGEENKQANYVRLSVEVACASSEFRIVNAVYYGLDRESLSSDASGTGWTDFAPDTLPIEVRHIACEGTLRNEPVANPFDDADDYWDSYWSQ